MKYSVKILGMTLGMILSWQSVNAKTILISDIDDTIKNSHVRYTSTIFNTYETRNLVMGMNTAYQGLAKDIPGIKFTYLSNAPDFIMMHWHRELLSDHKFPKGDLLMRTIHFEKGHKINNINKIIKRENPDLVILIGDNGEQDIDIYDEVVREHPNTKFLTYIHMLYYTGAQKETGSQVKGDQKPFATSLDLMLSLLDEGVVSPYTAGQFAQSFAYNLSQEPKMESDGILAFPRWMDCRDAKFNDSSIERLPEQSQLLARFALSKVKERCRVPRYNY
jgi:hypothetical protein